MRCIFCGNTDSKVLDSRANNDARVIRRRRECLACHRRFTTKEFVEEAPIVVVKVDSRRELFSRDKILMGIQLACKKRAISMATMEGIVDRIESTCRDSYPKEINTIDIGLAVMHELLQLDEIAYVRFASVYRKFQDKEEFVNELKELSCGQVSRKVS